VLAARSDQRATFELARDELARFLHDTMAVVPLDPEALPSLDAELDALLDA
jgi:hypothetical protein